MKIYSKSGTGLAGLAGMACVACCALPALMAGGVVSGGMATFLADRMPVIAVVLAVLAALAFLLAARRKAVGKAGCKGSCGRLGVRSAAGACGCTRTPA